MTGKVSENWDMYWRGGGDGAAYNCDGISHPAVRAFWMDCFDGVRVDLAAPRIVDVASGNGAVAEYAQAAFEGLPDLTCLDVSASAIAALRERFPAADAIVADAAAIPLASAAFDVVTSQFGVEYAGLDAIDEVARLAAVGGRLALLMHHRGGSIYRECSAGADAIERMRESGFIPRAAAMFETGFAACRGADRAPYDAAAAELAPAVRELEAIMTAHGMRVAGGLVARLYDDVATVHEGIAQYEPSEVLAWLDRLDVETRAFRGRMAAMCDAAVDADAFRGLCARLQGHGFRLLQADGLAAADVSLPLAWRLLAVRERTREPD